RHEEIRTQQQCVELTVGGLVATHPADRGALARVGLLVFDPKAATLGHRRTARIRTTRTTRNPGRLRARSVRRGFVRRVAHLTLSVLRTRRLPHRMVHPFGMKRVLPAPTPDEPLPWAPAVAVQV